MGKIGRRGPHKERKAKLAAERQKIKDAERALAQERRRLRMEKEAHLTEAQRRSRDRRSRERFAALLGVIAASSVTPKR